MRRRGIEHAAPALFVSGGQGLAGCWEPAFGDVYKVLLANLQVPDLLSDRRYAHPSPAFQGIYLWDSAFIAQVWKAWDPDVSLDLCLSVLSHQESDGRVPHVVGHVTQSVYTQPPLLAWSLWSVHNWLWDDRSLGVLSGRYDALCAYNRWLYDHRRVEGGLFAWAHPYESGVENAPRFSTRDERVLADTRRTGAPDFSAYMMLQNESLASIARALGHDEDAERFDRQREALRTSINEHLWHDGDGMYYDVDTRTGEMVRSRTIASLMPLWAGAADGSRADRLIERVLDPEWFGSSIPVPSVARCDPDFDKDMWRGSTWVNTAYGVILGLERYGRWESAGEIARRLVDGVYRTHQQAHRFYEFYDPDRCGIDGLSRKRGNLWKHLTLGDKPRADFVGWTGLVNTLVVEHLVGVRREAGRTVIRPTLPRGLAGVSLSVRVPGLGLTCQTERDTDGRALVTVRDATGVQRFEVGEGESIVLDGSGARSDAAQEGPGAGG